MRNVLSTRLLFLSAGVFLIACSDKSAKTGGNPGTQTDSAAIGITQPPTREKEIKLICRDLGEDSSGIPHFDVMLSVDGVQIKINEVYACSEITKDLYQRHEIPDGAIAACGGWYAGGGDYYYVIVREGKPVVFEGWLDEGQNDKGYHWKEIEVK
jgi:hypothetical protein